MRGIYQIVNKINNRRYVGQSRNIMQRIETHFNELFSKVHDNEKLQNDFNKYGYSGFYFEILELCRSNNLFNLESSYIKKLTHEDYNITGIKRHVEHVEKFIIKDKFDLLRFYQTICKNEIFSCRVTSQKVNIGKTKIQELRKELVECGALIERDRKTFLNKNITNLE